MIRLDFLDLIQIIIQQKESRRLAGHVETGFEAGLGAGKLKSPLQRERAEEKGQRSAVWFSHETSEHESPDRWTAS